MSDADLSDAALMRRSGIRPTRQRLIVAEILRQSANTHLTADEAHGLVSRTGSHLPLATVYNVLNDFAKAGLVRRFDFGDRTCFCRNRADHHHFLDSSTGRLSDIPGKQPCAIDLPDPPEGMDIDGVVILVKLKPRV